MDVRTDVTCFSGDVYRVIVMIEVSLEMVQDLAPWFLNPAPACSRLVVLK